MAVRRRCLPPGWYPGDAEGIREALAEWSLARAPAAAAKAAVAPHAGWAYSGRLAYLAIASLEEAETVAVIGGHSPGYAPAVAAAEEGFETPLGTIDADLELRAALARILSERQGGRLALKGDDAPDNSVEIQLPLVQARFPKARLLWLRAPNGPKALALGEDLARAAREMGRKVVCLGSTDLTHYGPAYDFMPAGRGPEAARWVREVNDRGFIEALLAMDAEAVLERGEEDRSACSSGAAAAALVFAAASGAARAELLAYATSLERRQDESFVGYAGVAFY